MLYQRILTAIPLALFVGWMIFYQPSSVFFYFLLFVVLVSAYEWAKLSCVKRIALRVFFAVGMTLLTWCIHQYASEYTSWSVYLAGLWWIGVTLYLKWAKPKEASSELKPGRLLVAFIVLPAAAFAMRDIHLLQINPGVKFGWQGPALLFYSLSLVWVADIGAYFFGKRLGRRKLAPHISPGKTKEGLWGAILVTSLYTVMAALQFKLDIEQVAMLIGLSIILTFISVGGDLYFSFLKREAGLKDSGNILPGHGGILDRIDSVLAAMPVFLIGFSQILV